MVSFEVRQTATIAARLLLLAALAAPYTTLSQPVFGPAGKAQLELLEKIEAEEARNGPYSEDLLDPLTNLSLLYQESGDHALAGMVIERALQVVRANYGLRTLDQAPLIQQWIQTEEARGNAVAAWDLEKALLALARRHPDDLRTVPILREIGDKRMGVLARYLAGEFPPQIVLGCYYNPFRNDEHGSCHAGGRDTVIRSIVSDAQRNYAAAIGVMLHHRLYASTELRELEMELVRSSYLHPNYFVGRQSLRRLASYDVANSEPWQTRMDGFIQVADWELLFNPDGSALARYERAYEELKKNDVAQASIEEIFSPKVPVVLPTFLPNPLVSAETPESTGYIDIAFEVSKYGRGRQVKILDTTTNATDAAEDRLVHLVLRSRFRPRVTDGQFARTAPIIVRYYLNESLDSRRVSTN